jgi:hypothetical protein
MINCVGSAGSNSGSCEKSLASPKNNLRNFEPVEFHAIHNPYQKCYISYCIAYLKHFVHPVWGHAVGRRGQ